MYYYRGNGKSNGCLTKGDKMRISVMPVEGLYHGVDRAIAPNHLSAKKNFKQILEMYFEYISSEEIELNNATAHIVFSTMYAFYAKLIENGIPCEIIVFDYNAIDSFYDKKLEFLGIDIVNDCLESLMLELPNSFDTALLNRNQLCDNLIQYDALISLLHDAMISNHSYAPCYVYRINC